jgi:hypothetical protein
MQSARLKGATLGHETVDLVDATDFEFIVSKAANRRFWTADFASFSIQITHTLRTVCQRWRRFFPYFNEATQAVDANPIFFPLGRVHPWSSRASFPVVDLFKRLPRRHWRSRG